MEIVTLIEIILGLGVIIAALLIYMSFKIVESGQVYAIAFLGEVRRGLRPSQHWIIPILETVTEVIFTFTRHEEFPAEPEKIVHSDREPVKDDEKRPFRVQQPGMEKGLYLRPKENYIPHPDEDPLKAYDLVPFSELSKEMKEAMKSDPANAPLTTVIPILTDWYVKDDDQSVRNHVNNIDNRNGSRDDEVRRRLADDGEVAMRELLGKFTPGQTVDMLEVFNAAFRWRIEVIVGEKPHPVYGLVDKPWGIHIAHASLKAGDLGETVNRARSEAGAAVSRREAEILDSEAKAIATVNQARADADKTRLQADAEAHRLRVTGQANADKILAEKTAEGEGEAAQVQAMAEALTKPGGLDARRLEVAQTALTSPNSKIFVPSHLGEIASVLSLGASLADGGSKTPPPTPPATTPPTTTP